MNHCIALAVFAAAAMLPPDTVSRKPDFSGTWVMDPVRSESAHQATPITSMSLVIRQSPSDISIETTRGETAENLTYRLDGSEMSIPGRSEVPVRTRARWEGAKLFTETARSINGAAVTVTHVLSLDKAGKALTIEKTLTVQHGYQATGGKNSGSGKDVFVRARAK